MSVTATATRAAVQPGAITVEPIGRQVGADIIGLDLTLPLTDAQFQQIHDAWMKHLVLRFRGQNLSKDQLQDFSRRFGELDKAPINTKGKPWVEGYPHMAVMSNIKVEGESIGSLGYGEAVWHTDMSYNEIAPTGALLYAVEVTKEGGETGFLNMYHAYETLPADLKAAIEGRMIKHDSSRNSAGDLRAGFKPVTDPREAPGAVHPAVIRHPVTGRKALFLGRRPFGYVMGMSLEDSEALLDRLWAHATRDEFAWYQKWKIGDLLIWDNRCVMHKRTAFDPGERRLLYRTQIKGAKPQA
ncbi:MAG: TauD/TfdA family dioxygenase [Burkholderiales bacterium]|nr:TauD/TfdA family dioxygenase [Burkholderiales bacterium]MCW5603703.1 TauD/TfdA family dioxygenase [Burkholderiales bacterium]